jgi:hemolysin III
MSIDALSQREELLNALTHGIGALASAIGGAVLITLAAVYGDTWQVVSASVFVATLLLLYTASTLYHAFRHERIKAKLKIFDHCAIFLLIAGTYTPFTLIGLRESWGWTLFGVIWTLAVLGVVFKLFFTGRFPRLSTMMYIAMGWLVVIAAKPMMENLSMEALAWLLAGGLAYTLGTVFYHFERLPYSCSCLRVVRRTLWRSPLRFCRRASDGVPSGSSGRLRAVWWRAGKPVARAAQRTRRRAHFRASHRATLSPCELHTCRCIAVRCH